MAPLWPLAPSLYISPSTLISVNTGQVSLVWFDASRCLMCTSCRRGDVNVSCCITSSSSHELTMLVLLIAICILSSVHATKLERVHDNELLNLIKVEKYVIVLFSKFLFFLCFSWLQNFLEEKILLAKTLIICIYYLYFIYVSLITYFIFSCKLEPIQGFTILWLLLFLIFNINLFQAIILKAHAYIHSL